MYYFLIWADCLHSLKKIKKNQNDWKIKSLIGMSLALSFNFFVIMLALQSVFFGFFYETQFAFFSGFENYIATLIVLYFLPSILINWYLVFYKSKFESIIVKYPFIYGGKLFLYYFVLSLLLPVIIVFVGILFTR